MRFHQRVQHMSSSFVAVSKIQSTLPRFAIFSSFNSMIFVFLPKKQPLDLFAHSALDFDFHKCETLCSKQFIILHSLNFLHSFKTILQSFKTILHSLKSFYICSKLFYSFLQEEQNIVSPYIWFKHFVQMKHLLNLCLICACPFPYCDLGLI